MAESYRVVIAPLVLVCLLLDLLDVSLRLLQLNLGHLHWQIQCCMVANPKGTPYGVAFRVYLTCQPCSTMQDSPE